ncbi:MAG: hypothetical protein ABI895_01170 [Deltaproteobacteria bacterium]
MLTVYARRPDVILRRAAAAGHVARPACGRDRQPGRGTVFADQVVRADDRASGLDGFMVAVAFGFSAQLLMTGILGEYVGRIYE